MRSIQPDGEVKLGVVSATQVACTTALAVPRVIASHVEVVEEARASASNAPIGLVW